MGSSLDRIGAVGVVLLALLGAAESWSAGPETRVSPGCCSVCKLWTGSEPDDITDAQFATISSLVSGSGGSKTFEMRCGQGDFFTFGPSAEQSFAGFAWVYGWGEARYGVLRLYAEAGAGISPTAYGPPFVIGTNPFAARGRVSGALVSFADLVTPPPTSGAPNPGDPTTIQATVHLSCAESGFTGAGAAVALYTPPDYDAQQAAYAVLQVVTRNGQQVFPCPRDAAQSLPATVGQPVVVYGVLTADMNGLANTSFPSTFSYVDALNTSVVTLADADGNPLTGASTYVYDAPGSLPTVTVTSSTTTTSTTLTPPTTLATCGNGLVDAGEACDCAATADPVLQGYGCRGAAVVPAQASCVVCRRCALEMHLCEQAGTTTTTITLSGGTSTTTTIAPGPCDGRAGLPFAACLLGDALDGPLCSGAAIPSRTDRKLRKALGAALTAIGRAENATEKAQRRLVKRARRALQAAARLASKAAASPKPAKQISESCHATIDDLAGAAQDALPL